MNDSAMFSRFTERARAVCTFAASEAKALKHNYVGTEHILLGLLSEDDTLAAKVLASLDVDFSEVRDRVVRIVGLGDTTASGAIPYTPRAKKILELALREALGLGHNYIGTEHILLGLIRENEGVAARILGEFNATAEDIRNEVIRALSGPGGRRKPPEPEAAPPSPREKLGEAQSAFLSAGLGLFKALEEQPEYKRLTRLLDWVDAKL